MDFLWHPTTQLVALHAAIFASVGLRVVMVRPVPSVALAWLFLVVLLPGIGLFCYALPHRLVENLARLFSPLL